MYLNAFHKSVIGIAIYNERKTTDECQKKCITEMLFPMKTKIL